MKASQARSRRSVAAGSGGAGRPGLVLLLAALIPVLIFVVIQTAVILGEGRDEQERLAMARATAISTQIDAEITADLRALTAVAQSINGVQLARNRPAPGRIEYNAELFPQWLGALIWSRDAQPDAPALFSSLPAEAIPNVQASWVRSLAGRPSSVGGIERIGDVVAPVIHLAVPRDPRNLGVSLVLQPGAFQSILTAGAPAGSVAALVDREGVFIARTVGIEERLGTPATTYVRDAISSGRSGLYRGRTYEGLENYTAFVTSDLTGWSVHIAVPHGLIEGPRARSLAAAVLGGLLCLAVMACLALLVASDMKRRRHEADMRSQAQKMETLGRLTGGIAHDFNNLLTVIVGNLEKLRRTMPEHVGSADGAAAIAAALEASDRAAKLTRSMLAYSRRQPLELRVLPVNDVVGHFAQIAGRTLGEGVLIEVDLDPEAGVIEVDDTQLGSAILNLAVNARDAMASAGTITIQTRRVSLSQDDDALGLKSGSYARLTVRDTGPGMDAATAARAFEPFFTTKPVGKGTGLGLSQVEGFARQLGGAADIETAPGQGTAVHLYLPLTAKQPDAARSGSAPTKSVSARPLSVLVVEDEDGVRANAIDLLRHMGHAVEAHSTAAAGLAALGAARYDLLFTDIVLPGDMNGNELAELARARQPDIAIILTTGYAGDALGGTADRFTVLPKPYSGADLETRIREVMGASAGSRRRRILLVEDETLIAMVAADVLVDAGFDVVDVATGGRALGELSHAAPPFDIAIIDLGLPDMDGLDLITEIRKRHPHLPVILASGRGAALDSEGGVPDVACIVDKPYAPAELVAAAKRMLGMT